MGTDFVAVSIGQVENSELEKLGQYGVSKVYKIGSERLNAFVNTAYASGISSIAKKIGSTAVVMAQTYNGRAVAPRVAVKLKAAPLSGVMTLLDVEEDFKTEKFSYSGKAVEQFRVKKEKMVILVKTNGYHISENPTAISIEDFDFSPNESELDAVAKEIVKASSGVSLNRS